MKLSLMLIDDCGPTSWQPKLVGNGRGVLIALAADTEPSASEEDL